MYTKNRACPSPAMPVAGAILFLALALIAVTPETVRAYGASLTCGDPTRTGHVEITIFICKDSECRHGITVKKTVAIHAIDNAADKARKIRDAIRGEVERNGGTVPRTPGPVVEVRNKNAEYEVEITKTKDDTGEPDISDSSYEGDPNGPDENLSFQTRVKLEGLPTEGLATFGENGEAVTVSTEGSTVEQIYEAWQAQLGGVIVSDGEAPCLALPPRSHPSSIPAERSFQYEVTDPGLSITVTQESLFDWRDAGPENSDIRLTLTNHGRLGFVDGTQTGGTGLVYPSSGAQHLYIGGVWLGLDPLTILNRDYDADPSPDWTPSGDPVGNLSYDQLWNYGQALSTTFRPQDPSTADIVTRVTATSFNLRDDLDDFVLLSVETRNLGTQPHPAAFCALFLDLDVRGGALDDFGSFAEAEGVLHLTSSEPGSPYLGLSLARDFPQCAPVLNAHYAFVPNRTFVWPNGYVPDPDKWGFLTGAPGPYSLHEASPPDDYSVVASTGPFPLMPGDQRTTQFIIAGGQTLDELRANIAMAQSIVCADGMLPADAPGGPLAPISAIRLTAVPNPSAGSTQFGLASRSPGEFAVELFDAGGRCVRTLNGGWRPAGVQSWSWDGRDERGRALPAGNYFARARTAEGTAAARVILAR